MDNREIPISLVALSKISSPCSTILIGDLIDNNRKQMAVGTRHGHLLILDVPDNLKVDKTATTVAAGAGFGLIVGKILKFVFVLEHRESVRV